MMNHRRRVITDFAAAVGEDVLIKPPPKAGQLGTPVTVRAIFKPKPSEHSLTALGLKAPANALLYVREAHVPAPLWEQLQDDLALEAGIQVIRGSRRYNISTGAIEDGEAYFALQDDLTGRGA